MPASPWTKDSTSVQTRDSSLLVCNPGPYSKKSISCSCHTYSPHTVRRPTVFLFTHIHIYIYMCVCVLVYVYIYISIVYIETTWWLPAERSSKRVGTSRIQLALFWILCFKDLRGASHFLRVLACTFDRHSLIVNMAKRKIEDTSKRNTLGKQIKGDSRPNILENLPKWWETTSTSIPPVPLGPDVRQVKILNKKEMGQRSGFVDSHLSNPWISMDYSRCLKQMLHPKCCTFSYQKSIWPLL